jgi:hypothetical protein
LNEIENKDITITPISKQQNTILKKRKASDTIIITSNQQIGELLAENFFRIFMNLPHQFHRQQHPPLLSQFPSP